jgi:hypothetical protein
MASKSDPDNCCVSDACRVRGHLTWGAVDLRLRAMREIWVAMTRPDGRPHAVPVWFWWNGVSLYFTARAGTLKPRSLAAAPDVVVHNGDGVDPIIVEGTATLVTEPVELQSVNAAYGEKYVDPATGNRAAVDSTMEAVFRVAVKRVQAWAYANAATQTVWQFG